MALLAGLLLAGAAIRVYAFAGLSGNDELSYAQRAYALSQGEYGQALYVFDSRIGYWAPVSLLYSLFGVSDLTTSLLPFLADLGSMALVIIIGRRLFGPMAGWLGGVLYAATPLVARMATTLRPGLSLGFWITLGALLLWLSLQERGQLSRRRILGLASGVALGIAWLCKEPAVFAVAALFAATAAATLNLRRAAEVLLPVAVGLGVVIGVEMAVYAWRLDDPLYRLHAMQHTYEISPDSFLAAGQGWGDILQRWLAGFWLMLLTSPEFGLVFWLCLPISVAMLWRARSALASPEIRFVAFWLWGLLFLFCFSTTSLKEYRPLILVPRYFAPLMAPAALLIAPWLQGLVAKPPARREMTLCLWGLAACSLALVPLLLARDQTLELLGVAYRLAESERRSWESILPRIQEQLPRLMLAGAAALTAAWTTFALARTRGWRAAPLVGLTLLTGLHVGILPTKGYLDPERRVAAFLRQNPEKTVVTDWMTAQRLNHLTGYRQTERILAWPERAVAPEAAREHLARGFPLALPATDRIPVGALLVASPNGYDWLHRAYEFPVPRALAPLHPDLRPVFDAGSGVRVYEVGPEAAAAW